MTRAEKTMVIIGITIPFYFFSRRLIMPTMPEAVYRRRFKKKLAELYPGSFVFYLDPEINPPGVPDLLFLYKRFWATFETKRFRDASRRPNQDYYVKVMNAMSYSRFLYPQNEQEVLHGLEQALACQGHACVSVPFEASLDKLRRK